MIKFSKEKREVDRAVYRIRKLIESLPLNRRLEAIRNINFALKHEERFQEIVSLNR